MDSLMTITSYIEFKAAFDGEIRRQSEGFVRMGYLLRVAEDTDVLTGSGYNTIAEFAKAEYSLTEDTVSRLIAINKRYSQDGYSDQLQEKYCSYGYTLLAEMLTMPEEVISALPEGVTRETLREIKKEAREESQISDIEVICEGEDQRQQELDGNLAKVLHQYYLDNQGEYPDMYKAMKTTDNPEGAAVELLAPSGIGVKMVRIQGIGKFMLSIKGRDQMLELVNLRSNENEQLPWSLCAAILSGLSEGKNYKAAFEATYGIPYPEPEKNAPAQPKNEDRKLEKIIEPELKEEPEPEADKDGEIGSESNELQHSAADCRNGDQSESQDILQCGSEEGTKDEKEQNEASPAKPEDVEDRGEEQQEGPVNTGEFTENAPAQEGESEAAVEYQMDVNDYPGVAPDSYATGMLEAEVITSHEVELWKEAAGSAERLFNTLQTYTWTPESGNLIKDMCKESEKMYKAITELDCLMEERN